jgi:hypothetical protein
MDTSLESEKSMFLYISLLYSPSSAHKVLNETLEQSEVLYINFGRSIMYCATTIYNQYSIEHAWTICMFDP